MAETRVTEGHDELARVLMHQDTFAVFDRAGAISSAARHEQGLYHRGTRHVSRLDLRIDGQRPMTLSSTVVRDNTLLAVDLTNPDLSRDGTVALPHGSVHLFRGCILDDGICHQRLRVHNFSVRRGLPSTCTSTWRRTSPTSSRSGAPGGAAAGGTTLRRPTPTGSPSPTTGSTG